MLNIPLACANNNPFAEIFFLQPSEDKELYFACLELPRGYFLIRLPFRGSLRLYSTFTRINKQHISGNAFSRDADVIWEQPCASWLLFYVSNINNYRIRIDKLDLYEFLYTYFAYQKWKFTTIRIFNIKSTGLNCESASSIFLIEKQ